MAIATTVKKLQEEMDVQRAAQAYRRALPLVAFAQSQRVQNVQREGRSRWRKHQ
jgi:hypothetical protein